MQLLVEMDLLVLVLSQNVHVTGSETKFVMMRVMLLHIILTMVIVLMNMMLVRNMGERNLDQEGNLKIAHLTGLET